MKSIISNNMEIIAAIALTYGLAWVYKILEGHFPDSFVALTFGAVVLSYFKNITKMP